MTTTQTQLRRDTATNLAAATPAAGEPFYDTTNKRLGVGDGSTAGGIPHAGAQDVQQQKFIYSTVGGTANAITLTNSPAVGAYAAPLKQVFKATATNTTATTVDVDGLGTKNVKKMLNGALANLSAGDIVSGGIYEMHYDGTQFQIKGLGVATPTPSGLVYLGTATASSSATIDLTSLMSSTYDDYMIIFSEVIPSASSAILTSLLMRYSTDNSTFNSGGNYSYAATGRTTAGAAVNSNSFGATSIQITPVLGANPATGRVMIYNVNSVSSPKAVTMDSAYVPASSTKASIFGGGFFETNSVVNAVRFLMASGNITSGTFKVYGISKT